ncbi:MAG: response regulator [Gemmatimonadetes bacterium]|nr:response regulator [Gemmatimonadota bacterium]
MLAVTSAADALRALATFRPDILVVDLMMPGESGYDLMRSVRALDPGRGGSTPALAITAFAGAETRGQAAEAGFQSHLTKPLDPEDLAAAVKSLHAASLA